MSDYSDRSDVPREVILLAEALSRKHGEIHVARESSGIHLYMASPILIEEEGAVELRKRHLAVNIDKFMRTGQWKNRAYDSDWCGQCMKSGKAYRMSQLLSMPSLTQRGVPDVPVMQIKVHSMQRSLVQDANGNWIPTGPGTCVPLFELAKDHIARWYIERRGYDVHVLWRQFRASYCTAETPEDRDKAVYYRRLPLGFNDTPQGRIIFFGDVKGVQRIWQARVIDHVDGDIKYFWHPYDNRWVDCEKRDPATGKFVPLPHVVDSCFEWGPSKYKTQGPRNENILGYDAAIAWNRTFGMPKPIGFLTEGALDGGRWGPPGMALMGKSLSAAQAKLLCESFKRIVYVKDKGKAGEQAAKSVEKQLGLYMPVDFADIPANRSDPGEMETDEAWALVKPFIS